MKTQPTFCRASCVALAACLGFAGVFHAAEGDAPIDPVRGRALMQKSKNGETLTAEEQAYLDRVKQAIRERAAGKRSNVPPPSGEPRPTAPNTADWSGLVPITDMTTLYKGEDGGLYGGGKNDPRRRSVPRIGRSRNKSCHAMPKAYRRKTGKLA